MVQRLSEQESMAYLKANGVNIALSTFYNWKKNIKESRFKRMREIADTGFIDYHLDAIDTLEWAKKEMITNYYKVLKNDAYKATEILTQLINMLPFFAEYIAESKEVMERKAITESLSSKEETKTAVPS
jgi:hypothetical protein